MSKKRRSQLSARAEVVRLVHERDQSCVFWSVVWDSSGWIEGDLVGAAARCIGPLDVHEIIPRSAWPGGELVVDNCVTLCGLSHHPWVTNNPDKAHRIGLHGFSWERPS